MPVVQLYRYPILDEGEIEREEVKKLREERFNFNVLWIKKIFHITESKRRIAVSYHSFYYSLDIFKCSKDGKIY